MSESTEHDGKQAVLKVVGVGGAGINAVNSMIDGGLKGVECLAVSVTQPRLRKSRAAVKICLGTGQGFGTGGDPALARDAAQESRQALREQFEGTDLVFIAAGMGSGTGTGAAPVVAAIENPTNAINAPPATRMARANIG